MADDRDKDWGYPEIEDWSDDYDDEFRVDERQCFPQQQCFPRQCFPQLCFPRLCFPRQCFPRPCTPRPCQPV